jgi:hypothetical protein
MYGIDWDAPDKRYFQHGVDHGVFYPASGVGGVPWNGITGMNESGNGSSTMYYIDGQIYLADVDPTDFSGSLSAFFWPDEFAQSIGFPQVAEGLFMDNQKAKRFNFCYRSLVGNGTDGDLFGYQIHLIYNCMASSGAKQRKTLSDTTSPMEFSFDIVATPVKIPGFRPTAHLVIDTRYLTPETVVDLETILYGDGDEAIAQMPDPTDLFEMMSFGDAITVTVSPDGFVKIEGKSANIVQLTPDTFQINNINATAPDVDGQVVISDGGDTDVIIL